MQHVDHIELLIVTSDGRRLKFVGHGELVEVDNLEPHPTQMRVTGYIAPIIDRLSGQAVAHLCRGDPISIYTHVRRPHAGTPHKLIAVGPWKGYWISESAIERVRPDTLPSLPTEDVSA
ncbi:MAG: hypothetical protein DPW16_22025 [Chloroflexi bacterium]|nr:hypothetical protein [Chloroflexota bacterium]